MEKEKTFEELARDVVRRQENEEALTGTDIETASKLGVPKMVRGAATEEERAEVRELYRKGIGVCEIARRTGFAQSTISRWVGTWAIDRSKSVHAKKAQNTKNEPAPSANDTSSKTTSQVKNTTEAEICQAKVSSAADNILQIYDSMTQEEQRAFDLGEVYRRLLEIIEMEDKHNEE